MAQNPDGSVSITALATAAAVTGAGVTAAVDPDLVQAAATFGGSALIAASIVLVYSAIRHRGRSR